MNGSIESAFIGKVTDVAGLRTSQAGKPWLALKVAVGHGEDSVQWVRTACFGAVAEQLAATLQKGDKVYCEGTLKLDRWKNGEGEERSGLSCAAWKVEKVGASAIGRNRPVRYRAASDGDNSVPPTVGDGPQDAETRQHWQRPLDDPMPF